MRRDGLDTLLRDIFTLYNRQTVTILELKLQKGGVHLFDANECMLV